MTDDTKQTSEHVSAARGFDPCPWCQHWEATASRIAEICEALIAELDAKVASQAAEIASLTKSRDRMAAMCADSFPLRRIQRLEAEVAAQAAEIAMKDNLIRWLAGEGMIAEYQGQLYQSLCNDCGNGFLIGPYAEAVMAVLSARETEKVQP